MSIARRPTADFGTRREPPTPSSFWMFYNARKMPHRRMPSTNSVGSVRDHDQHVETISRLLRWPASACSLTTQFFDSIDLPDTMDLTASASLD